MEAAEFKKRFAQGLSDVLRKEEITPKMLAEWVGVGESSVSHWRSGRSLPQGKTREALETVLRMKIEDIAGEELDALEPMRKTRRKKDELGRCFSIGLERMIRRRRITVAQLAREAGLPQSSVRNWVNCEMPPSVTAALLIAEVLDTTVEEIVRIGEEA